MITRDDLPELLYLTLQKFGGRASIVEVCKAFWNTYNGQLQNSGNLFYTWQYDIRWAATELRKSNKMKSKEISEKGIWETI